MLAGWMTLEARLASAFIVLLVFAAGMMPARVQAAPGQIGLNAVPTPRPTAQGGGRENLPWPQVGSRVTLTSAEGGQLVVDGITHYRPGHSTLAAVELLQANHIPYMWHGENIIWEGSMPWAEVPAFFNDWWMASPAHRDNILNPHYRSVGIGIANTGDAVYMVEVFSDQVGDSAETPSLLSPGGARRYRAMSRQQTSPM